MIRLDLSAVCLLDYAVDVQRPEHCARPLVIKNDNPVAAWSDVSVVDRRHCIFVTVGCAH